MIYDATYEELKPLVEDKKIPMVICDLDAFNNNLELVGKYLRKTGKKLRLCTKSVRVPELITKVNKQDFVSGVFTYNSAETLFLAEKHGIKDILMGYPTASRVDAQELCQATKIEGTRISVMADSVFHLDLLEEAASSQEVKLDVLLEVDVADHFLGINVGVLRSPLREPEQVVKLAREIKKRKHLRFKGFMAYEAQNASLGDDKFLYRYLKKRSRPKVDAQRAAVMKALKENDLIEEDFIVNGGGSGCVQETAADPTITEIGIGSLLFKSHVFDPIESLNEFIPSLYFVLQIVRKPCENYVTAFSGGYVSSGVKAQPQVFLPKGLVPTEREGFGEVQTPFKYNPKKLTLHLGDPIFCRFGKAGEPLTRFNEIHVYSDEKMIGNTYLTYRGFGKQFS
ncbi:MAG: alanine racemase [Promethearchaeota archaeon]